MAHTTSADLKIEKPQRQYIPKQFVVEWDTLAPIFEELEKRPLDSLKALEQWMRDRSELEAALQEDYAWRYIRMTCDTADAKYLEDFQYFATEIEPQLSALANTLDKKLNDSRFAQDLDPDTYRIYLRKLQKSLALFREENIPLFTEIQVAQQKYQSISGSMNVTIDGKEYTLAQAAVFLKDPDRQRRKEVWEQITQRRLQDKTELDDLFNHLRTLRDQVAKNAGFANFRDYMFESMGRFDYSYRDCEAFHEAIARQVVPLLRAENEQRKSDLGLTTLKPWDMDVDPSGLQPLKPFHNGEELIDKTITCFAKLSPYLGERIAAMKANQLFDVESRNGKAPGGYNYPLAETGAPFIFMNAAGTLHDLTTMVHEGGHAIHTFISAHLALNEFKDVPSEVAELASMSMELISMDHWDVFFDNEADLKRAKREQLQDVLKTLPWVATVDRFQHWLYTHPDHTDQERADKWAEIFRYFGANFCDWGEEQAAMENLWQKQLHIFEVPFYYIEYGMAQLGAVAIWKNYHENPERTLSQYLAALQLGYTKTIPELYETAGIRFDFSENNVRELMTFVKEKLDEL